jgi:DNA-directed RNA polymerase subunit RPC12/RpoP
MQNPNLFSLNSCQCRHVFFTFAVENIHLMDETKRCPYCGEEILAVARKCKHCGEWLDDEPHPSKSDDKEPDETNEFRCPKCGMKIAANSVVCPHCLCDIKEYKDSQEQPEAENVAAEQTTADATEVATDSETRSTDEFMYCPACGFKIPVDTEICPRCHAQVQQILNGNAIASTPPELPTQQPLMRPTPPPFPSPTGYNEPEIAEKENPKKSHTAIWVTVIIILVIILASLITYLVVNGNSEEKAISNDSTPTDTVLAVTDYGAKAEQLIGTLGTDCTVLLKCLDETRHCVYYKRELGNSYNIMKYDLQNDDESTILSSADINCVGGKTISTANIDQIAPAGNDNIVATSLISNAGIGLYDIVSYDTYSQQFYYVCSGGGHITINANGVIVEESKLLQVGDSEADNVYATRRKAYNLHGKLLNIGEWQYPANYDPDAQQGDQTSSDEQTEDSED